jgi:hypothetical protein
MTADPAPAAASRVRRIRSLVERPADAWLLCRMATWAAALPVLKHLLRLETLARLMWTDRESKSRPQAAKIVALSRLLAPPAAVSGGACYERSLLAYRFLAQRGADPKLVVAVKSDGGAVSGHAWITVDGRPVGESGGIEDFVPIVVYGRGGRSETRR